MNDLERLARQVELGRVSRRDFFKAATAMGAGLVLADSILTTAMAQATPIKGGTLRLGLHGMSTTDSLDPATYTDEGLQVHGGSYLNLLFEADGDRKLQNAICESAEPRPGAVEWVLDIRKGVEFHNGKTVDADDVIFSVMRHVEPDSTSGGKGILSAVKEMKKLDTHQVLVTCTTPNADLPYVLADYHAGIVPNGFSDWAKAVGTGAYKVESFDPGVASRFVRNPNYWRSDLGHVDALEITGISDFPARMNALQTGQVDAINRLDRKAVALLERSPSLSVINSPGGQFYIFALWVDEGPVSDNNIRTALKYAIDRQKIVDTVLRGYGTLGNDHPIPHSDPFFNSELPQRPYDPEQARFWLKKSGLDRLVLRPSVSDAAFEGGVDTGVLFAESAKAANITLDLVREPNDGYWDNVWLKKPFSQSYWGGRPTADLMLSVAFKSDAPWNDTHWKNERFDTLLLEARATTDFNKRKELYWEMQRMLYEGGGYIVPMFANYLDGYSNKVKGTRQDANFGMMGFRVAEEVWLEG